MMEAANVRYEVSDRISATSTGGIGLIRKTGPPGARTAWREARHARHKGEAATCATLTIDRSDRALEQLQPSF